MGYKNPDAQREYQRNWIAQRRAKWFKGKCCVRCGSTEQLELDHIDRDQKVDHRIWSWSWKRIEEETAKCQVLCKKCHDEKTFIEERGQRIVVHGTEFRGYDNGCRCSECRAAHATIIREWRYRTGRRSRPAIVVAVAA